ncbi:MAG: type II toxin-antitoxin system VapC family toxin [Micropruina sp.]
MIIVDAGVWVRALVDSSAIGDACRVVLCADPDWVAPSHAAIETLRTLRRYEAAGLLTRSQADAHAEAVTAAEVRYIGAEPWVLTEVWRLRHTISPDDAPYVAVPLALDVPLATLDERLARAAGALGASVVVPGSA